MQTDRGETRNLAVEARYSEILREHREILRQWFLTHPACSLTPRPGNAPATVTDRSRHLRLIPEKPEVARSSPEGYLFIENNFYLCLVEKTQNISTKYKTQCINNSYTFPSPF